MEVYNNTFTGTDLNKFVGGVRSGGVLFHDNALADIGAIQRRLRLKISETFTRLTPGAAPTEQIHGT